ncbi:MAG: Hsp33 family molecular chaperone HslO [Treponemataceae bacterium]|nr:Hsp33 family molecular chaperone HslO [Treponemataceae bacterium]
MIKAEIKDKELLEHLSSIEKDGMSIFVMAGGRIRGALFNGSRFVNDMRVQHNLGILETMILGQACLCGALMIPTMKGREHLVFRYDTNGPAAGFSVEADSAGTVRGFLLQNPVPVDKPLESWDLSPFFGPGTVSVTRMQEGNKVPQTGTTEIMFRNIAQDLTWYFQQSEQIQTAFNTSILMDRAGRVTGAGGLFLQVMPEIGGKLSEKLAERAAEKRKNSEPDAAQGAAGAASVRPEVTVAPTATNEGSARNEQTGAAQNVASDTTNDDLLDRVEAAFRAAPPLGQWFSEKGDRDDIIYGLFREFSPSVVLERDILFDCPCSKEVFTRHVKNLGAAELADIKKNGPDPLEIVCHNCGSVYCIPVSEL